MDIFQTLHPADPARVTDPQWVVPADPTQERLIAMWCDGDRRMRPNWPDSIHNLLMYPVDGRIPEEVAR